ncbi:hypothetical protein COI63_09085 [Bacillus toyonensis]|uniref:Crystaline entomocidal protoxin n=1 Tax=Bacillus thuringiensis TaxID=1428 RepID=U5KRS3_BACTU|nr:insecticidal delta-endotoxin Cry8Ea1 family protein [Bacillus toyonensis]AGU13874.1 pesticidal protein [Bacillus thuringiensis]PHG14137.1 hypothetical protein COI63_09085 [Bacillus toyonensis]
MKQNSNDEYEILDSKGMHDPYKKFPIHHTSSPSFDFKMGRQKEIDTLSLIPEEISPLFNPAAIITAAKVLFNIGSKIASGKRFLDSVLAILWPEAAAQSKWEEFIALAEQLIQEKIAEYARGAAIAKLIGLKDVMMVYEGAFADWEKNQTDPQKQEAVRNEFRNANDIIVAAMPEFAIKNYEIQLLTVYAEAANLHLTLLRDASIYGLQWGMGQSEVDRHYTAQMSRTQTYTDYCVSWYDIGLEKAKKLKANIYDRDQYPWIGAGPPPGYPMSIFQTTEDWNLFNNFRRDMTLQVLDLVAYWPTYDVKKYPISTQVQLTRDIYTNIWGIDNTSVDKIEAQFVRPPHLVTHLDALDFYVDYNLHFNGSENIMGERKVYNYTSEREIESPISGKQTQNKKTLTVRGNPANTIRCWHYVEASILDFPGRLRIGNVVSGWGGAWSTAEIPDNHISWITTTFPTPSLVIKGMRAVGFSWMSNTVDPTNTVAPGRITQIPAVKARDIGPGGRVIKGPGTTGGDLVELNAALTTGISLNISSPQNEVYTMRIRYASRGNGQLRLTTYQYSGYAPRIVNFNATDSSGSLKFNSFNYLTIGNVAADPTALPRFVFDLYSGSPIIIDKIEFLPRGIILEEAEANQDLEKARKAVNALFTNDAKDNLKLNMTDYAIDQAANLVECLSDEFCDQEKMILLDQVKFAKRLSQARNLLNYGDFESPDWSGENGWKTSPHVHVASDNPIFKGRYLHMPGANQPQMSDTVYPTYLYQKVDESKLKSYTRYHVRGFVGNSKDLALLVERYGKEVHVEMDVPNDIRYTLPMNECGGFDRCGHSSYQAGTDSHTCTCKDPAQMDAACQCKDKSKRTASGVYTNVYAGSDMMYLDGYHAHTSCGCKDPHVFSFHIDTGCVDVEENAGLLFALKIASTDGVANIDNLEIIEGQPLTGEALARVKKREHKWKEERKQKRCKTKEAVEATLTAINALFTNKQYNRLKFETLFPHILHADELVKRIPYVYHPFLRGAYPEVPGMNYDIFQQLSALVARARGLYDMRNLVQNGTFSAGIGNWQVTDGVTTRLEGNTSVLVLREWSDKALQHLRIDAERGYVLRVTARKEGNGDGYVVIHDCDNQQEKVTFTACDSSTMGASTGTQATVIPATNCPPCHSGTWGEEMTLPVTMLSGYVTKTAEIFPDTDRIRVEIGETEGTFKVESVELICMEHMEDHMYDMAGNLEEEMQGLGIESSHAVTYEMCFSWDIQCPMEASIPPIVPPTTMYDMAGNVEEEIRYL